MQNRNIYNELLELSDEKYKIFQKRIVPIDNIIGVRIPKIRKYAKSFNEEEKIYYIESYIPKYLEDTILIGLMICDLKADIKLKLKYIKKYTSYINNWASCDTFCSSFKIKADDKKCLFNFLEDYFYSDNEFDIRFSLVMLLNNFILDEYIDKVFYIIKKVRCSKYYDKMSYAWLISIIYIKYPNQIIEFLKNSNLDRFTHNKAIQKIIESNKVSKKEKEFIRLLKLN